MKNVIKIASSEIDYYFIEREKNYVNHFFGIKSLTPIIIEFILAISFIYPLFTGDNYIKSIVFIDETKQVFYKKYYFFIIIGIVFLLHSIYGFYKNRRERSIVKKLFRDKLDELKEVNSEIEFKLNDEELELSSKIKNWSRNWKSFDYYKTDTQYLKIYSINYHKSYPEIIIPLKYVEEDQIVWLEKRLAKK
ncbi:hypothetical protein [Winogradskyella haliclonae]|uniref:YcxB-like protein domain-containing protein n=1 Tax=Winogradskyella haliclonae TaxID=2048558 RepID=A0ABQ2BX61_9FLAO|nr:hypothetical protein [Winogradskyella haliclonae]GGI56461.1 hypothetical protein GCM10011444_07700 [Winogradskyella haliclonae]